MVLEIDDSLKLSSDLYFRLKHKGGIKNKLICRFALNPAFINEKYLFLCSCFSIMILQRKTVDPDKIARNPGYSH